MSSTERVNQIIEQAQAAGEKSLRFDGIEISDRAAHHLAQALPYCTGLTELRLGINQLGPQGARSIAEVLNLTLLKTLIIRYNHIGNEGLNHLCIAMQKNHTITALHLPSCKITENGADDLSAVLQMNNTLLSLDLRDNFLESAGTERIASGLRQNSTLTYLDLNGNSIGDHGVRQLSQALFHNTSLTAVHLDRNVFDRHGLQSLIDVIKVNTTLTTLNTGIVPHGGEEIMQAVRLNRKPHLVLELQSRPTAPGNYEVICTTIAGNVACKLDLPGGTTLQQLKSEVVESLQEELEPRSRHVHLVHSSGCLLQEQMNAQKLEDLLVERAGGFEA